MIELAALFDYSSVRRSKFDSFQRELEAVRSHTKAMSYISFPQSEIDKYVETSTLALKLGLSVIYHSVAEIPFDYTYAFFLYPEESWRVQAYILARTVIQKYSWSDAAEHLMSALLGYTEDDISSWMARINAVRLTWTGKTFYMLMSRQQQELIARLGMRCIDPQSMTQPIAAFYSRSNAIIKKDADNMMPEDMVIGRVSVKEGWFRKLFGKIASADAPDVVSATITAETATLLNSELDSNFQFLDADDWH